MPIRRAIVTFVLISLLLMTFVLFQNFMRIPASVSYSSRSNLPVFIAFVETGNLYSEKWNGGLVIRGEAPQLEVGEIVEVSWKDLSSGTSEKSFGVVENSGKAKIFVSGVGKAREGARYRVRVSFKEWSDECDFGPVPPPLGFLHKWCH